MAISNKHTANRPWNRRKTKLNPRLRTGTIPELEPVEVTREIDRLVENVNPKAEVPRFFAMWSRKLQLAWLRAHQKRGK